MEERRGDRPVPCTGSRPGAPDAGATRREDQEGRPAGQTQVATQETVGPSTCEHTRTRQQYDGERLRPHRVCRLSRSANAEATRQASSIGSMAWPEDPRLNGSRIGVPGVGRRELGGCRAAGEAMRRCGAGKTTSGWQTPTSGVGEVPIPRAPSPDYPDVSAGCSRGLYVPAPARFAGPGTGGIRTRLLILVSRHTQTCWTDRTWTDRLRT